MKLPSFFSRSLKWIALSIAAVTASSIVQAQLTPTWTINHGQTVPGVTHGTYFNNLNVSGSVAFSADTPTINFDWGFGSPAATVAADGFSANWSGMIIPKASETYTFHVTSDDGVRVWLDGQLILDNWVVQSATEVTSIPLHLTAGTMYWLKIDYFELHSAALIKVFWK